MNYYLYIIIYLLLFIILYIYIYFSSPSTPTVLALPSFPGPVGSGSTWRSRASHRSASWKRPGTWRRSSGRSRSTGTGDGTGETMGKPADFPGFSRKSISWSKCTDCIDVFFGGLHGASLSKCKERCEVFFAQSDSCRLYRL